MISRLIRLRAGLWWAEEKARSERNERLFVYAFLLVASVITVWAAVLVFYALGRGGARMATAALVLSFLAIGATRLVMSIPRMFERGLLARDMDIWLSAPVSTRALFALKSVEIGADGALAALVSFACAYGYARASGFPAAFIVGLVSAAALVTLTGLAAQVVALLLIRIVPPARLKMLTALLPFIVMATFLTAQQFWFARRMRAPPTDTASGIGEGVVSFAERLWWLPTTWAANLAAAPAAGRWDLAAGSLALVVLASGAAFVIGSWMFQSVFVVAWQAMREESRTRRRGILLPQLARVFRPRVAAVVLKDWRTTFRDPKLLVGMFGPLVFVGIMVLGPIGTIRSDGGMEPYWLLYLVAILSTFAQHAFLAEDRNFALLRSAPVPIHDLMLAKAVGFGAPVVALTWVMAVLFSWGDPIARTVAMLVGGTWIAGWTFMLNLGIAAVYFDPHRERNRPDPGSGLAGMIGSVLLAGAHVGFGYWAWRMLTGTLQGPISSPAFVIVPLGLFIASCWTSISMLRRGMTRLQVLPIP